MKFRVMMKDPDTLSDAIRDAAEESVALLGLDLDEREVVEERRIEKTRDLCHRWFKYGECLTVEIDTEAQTCTVVETE